ncbi:MAG: hypothetical protein IKA12_04655 [Clostridia bacterium]|nr:hypothetical protein [Clostridia bacterium]
MPKEIKTQYDYMKEADKYEEDAICPEEWLEELKRSDREKYFEFYDDIKTSIKEDW